MNLNLQIFFTCYEKSAGYSVKSLLDFYRPEAITKRQSIYYHTSTPIQL